MSLPQSVLIHLANCFGKTDGQDSQQHVTKNKLRTITFKCFPATVTTFNNLSDYSHNADADAAYRSFP